MVLEAEEVFHLAQVPTQHFDYREFVMIGTKIPLIIIWVFMVPIL